MRWTWIDRFTAFESRRSATAVKCLSLAEDHFADHFPGFPVMPAPLILEGLAQTGGILVGEANQFNKNVVLAKMSAKFHREAMAGEQLTYCTDMVDLNETGARVSGKVHSGTELIAEAELVENKRGRVFEAKAELRNAAGEIVASATGKYMPIRDVDLTELKRDLLGDVEWLFAR